MASSKATSKKSSSVKKPVARTSKTTVRTVKSDAASVSAKTAKPEKKPLKTVVAPAAAVKKSQTLPSNIVNIVVAELFGTFVLTLVVLFAAKESGSLYVGFVVTVLALAVAVVSGAHFNPAVTLAKWTMRQLNAVLLPFYWGSQFLGSMLAVIVINWLTNNALRLDFSRLWSINWAIFGVEMLGAIVLMFGFAAATNRKTLSSLGVALGTGLSFMAGLVIASSMLANVQGAIDTSQIESIEKVPHELRVKAALVNPAVALAATEHTDATLTGQAGDKNEKQVSRLSLETVLGPLLGAVIGGNLYLLVAGSRRDQ